MITLFHARALYIAVAGFSLAFLLALFGEGPARTGLRLGHELPLLANLLLLLTGFAVLASQFELSRLPDQLPRFLPSGWWAGVCLLGLVFVLSTFLDNIAGAVIGGVLARQLYAGSVSLAFAVGIVAAANAGGAGSVLGDTTTTMLWIGGIEPARLAQAFVGATAAFAIFAPVAALAQHRHAPAVRSPEAPPARLDPGRVVVVAILLLALLGAHAGVHLIAPHRAESWPWLGTGLWAGILATAAWRRPDWSVLREGAKGAIFLVALVALASLMPLGQMPEPGWETTLGLGFLSALFDNIPLTALAFRQGGYDWGLLAFAVGFGGSMLWFGSSAGVAVSNLFPHARSAIAWLRAGWAVPIAYVAGFAVQAVAFQ
ncbi:MAG: citrate transporter [Pseudomonadota bacterium]